MQNNNQQNFIEIELLIKEKRFTSKNNSIHYETKIFAKSIDDSDFNESISYKTNSHMESAICEFLLKIIDIEGDIISSDIDTVDNKKLSNILKKLDANITRKYIQNDVFKKNYYYTESLVKIKTRNRIDLIHHLLDYGKLSEDDEISINLLLSILSEFDERKIKTLYHLAQKETDELVILGGL